MMQIKTAAFDVSVFTVTHTALNWVKGFLNIVTLTISGEMFKYLCQSYKIRRSVTRLNVKTALLISSGPSLEFNKSFLIEKINDADVVIINSYNTYNVLGEDVKKCINDKLVFYYQAPWHEPIDRGDFKNNICNVMDRLSKDSVAIYDPIIEPVPQSQCKQIPFRVRCGLDQFGIGFKYSSGALSMIDLLAKSSINNLQLFGVDLSWDPRPIAKIDKLNSYLSSLVVTFQSMLDARSILNGLKKKAVVIQHIDRECAVYLDSD